MCADLSGLLMPVVGVGLAVRVSDKSDSEYTRPLTCGWWVGTGRAILLGRRRGDGWRGMGGTTAAMSKR